MIKKIKRALKKSVVSKEEKEQMAYESENPDVEEVIEEVIVSDKDDTVCVVDGCSDKKAEGQTHVCTKHVRAG